MKLLLGVCGTAVCNCSQSCWNVESSVSLEEASLQRPAPRPATFRWPGAAQVSPAPLIQTLQLQNQQWLTFRTVKGGGSLPTAEGSAEARREHGDLCGRGARSDDFGCASVCLHPAWSSEFASKTRVNARQRRKDRLL